MKNFINYLLGFLLISLTIQSSQPKITTMALRVGQTQRIELHSNPTTGYSWYPTNNIKKNPIMSLVKSGYEADDTGLVGSGGTQFWDIKGNKKGSYTLILEYKRPWEKNIKPVEVKKFAITVK